jgi:fucose permease
VHFTGALIGVLVAMRAVERVSGRLPVMVATGVVGLGCAGAAVAPSWPAFVVAVFVVGLGGGALVLALNQLVAFSEGGRRAALLNALNSAYSAGAVTGPILVAAFAGEHFSLLYLCAAALALVLVGLAGGISGRLPVSTGSPGRPELLVLIFVAAFVLYVGIENGTGGWMTSHLESVGLHSKDAAAYTSGFWLALVTGRLLMTLVPSTVPEPAIVLAGSAVAAISLFAALIGEVAPWAYLVTGLAIAPIFPTGIVWLAKLRPGDSRATSWLYPASSLGGIVGPGAIGLVIAGFGVGWAPLVLGLVATGMLIAFAVANRSTR